jgi:hypothetical protein
MATVLDVSLLGAVGVIFPVIVVFAITFAVLRKTKWLGQEGVAIDAVIAASVALMVLLSEKLVALLNFIIPWFAVAIIFFMLLLLVFMVFGLKEKNFMEAVQNSAALMWTIIGIGLIIMVAGGFSILGQDLTDQAFSDGSNVAVGADGTATTTGNFDQNLNNILFNPKVLGVMVIFAILVLAVALLTGAEKAT